MKKYKYLGIVIIGLFAYCSVFAQETIIRGRVVDAEDKTTIVGANVVEYDKDDRIVNGTVTNIDGDFMLEMNNPSNIVRVRMIGYKAKEIDINPYESVVIEIEPENVAIEGVTITAESKATNSLTNLDDRDKASSSVKLDLADMQDAGVLSASDALQGKVSGLDIISASGDPGSGSQLVIRGLSSMGNNQPLIVIDGIPQFRVSSSFDLSSADSEDISNLINIALQDIKSIEVLKDAGSTAIYGSQGADGVLLIETNKGRMGKVQFDYQYRNNLNIQPPAIPMLNGDEYIMLQLEEWHNRQGVFTVPQEIAYNTDYVDFYNYSANTNWLEEITQNGVSQDHYFSVSGGGQKTRYFTSFNYLNEGGTTINTGYNRFSTRVNLDYFLSRKLLFQIKFNYTKSNTDGNLKINNRNIREMAYIKAPNMSIWEYDANGELTGEFFTPITSYQGNGVSFFNPIAVGRLGKNDKVRNDLNNTFTLRYRLNDWLTLRETVSFQFGGEKGNTFLPHNAIGADWLDGQVNSGRETNNIGQQIRTETQIAFGTPFKSENHEISGALTLVTQQSKGNWMGVMSARSPSTDVQDPSADPVVWTMWNGSEDKRLVRSVNNLNYKYKDKYLIQGILTVDGHSSFGSNNRWGLFNGIFVGWRFSNEPVFNSISWLGESMIRASYGVSGRQPEDVYARFATYESTGTGTYITNPAVAPTKVELSNLKWENITSYDVGIELNLLNDRVYFEGNIYEKTTSDILFGGPSNKPWLFYQIPSSSGYYYLQYFNGGQLINNGWEIMADFRMIRNENWMWSMNLNASQNINRFSELPDNFNSERSTSIGNGQFPLRVVEGEPIGSFFGFRYLGVFASDEEAVAKDANGNVSRDSEGNSIPLRYTDTYTFQGGDPIYDDINHDGKIDLNDVMYIGDSNPDFIGGFGTNVQYKNWDLSASFHYRTGFDIINGIAIQTQGMNNRNNQSKATLRRWRIQGQDEENMLPRAYMNHPANNLGSDRYVEKGDYLRLNNLKLSYRLNQQLLDRVGLRKAIFSISARKLYTFTNYTGQDPEVGQDASNPFWIGVDKARTPPPRVFTLSISLGI